MRIALLPRLLLLPFATIFHAGYSQSGTAVKQGEWNAPKSADTLLNPLEYNEVNLKAGKTQFVLLCVPCHGEKGKGDGIASVELNPKPGNLVSAKVQNQKDGAIFWKITKGKGAMVSYEQVLSAEQRWALVHYIRQLALTEKKK